jgi:hypothetical protein
MQIIQSIFNFLGNGFTSILLLFLVLLIILLLYFLPSLVASARHKRQFPAIFLINLFTGWTFIGWFGALIWAVIVEKSDYEVIKHKEVTFKPKKIQTKEFISKPEKRQTIQDVLTKKRSIKGVLTHKVW